MGTISCEIDEKIKRQRKSRKTRCLSACGEGIYFRGNK